MIPYKNFQPLITPHFRIGLYQEPTRVAISLGVDISERGWRNPLFHLRFLIWEIDFEIDYSDPGELSEWEKAVLSIKNYEKAVKKSVNT